MKRTAPRLPQFTAHAKPPPSQERLLFIDRLTRPLVGRLIEIFEICNPRCESGLRNTETRIDSVRLKIACGGDASCSSNGHIFDISCYPERVCDGMAPVPDEALLLAPYTVSISFWRRVQCCVVDKVGIFDHASRIQDGIPEIHKSVGDQCFVKILEMMDLIYTLVLDHVSTMYRSTIPDGVLPSCFDRVPFCAPHAFLAHGHRWGDAVYNPLELYPNSTFREAFWNTYDAACARVQRPTSVPTALFIKISDRDPLGRGLYPGNRVPSSFGSRFPCAHHALTMKDVCVSFVTEFVRAFPTVRTMIFAVNHLETMYEPNVGDLISSIVAHVHFERCTIVSERNRLDPRSQESVDLLRDVCSFVEKRNCVMALTCADYKSLPLKAARDNIHAWTAYFDSPIFERHTLGIVCQFLNGPQKQGLRHFQERLAKIFAL